MHRKTSKASISIKDFHFLSLPESPVISSENSFDMQIVRIESHLSCWSHLVFIVFRFNTNI